MRERFTGLLGASKVGQDFSELDDFDDESLLRLAQAFGCLEQTRWARFRLSHTARAAPEAPKQVLQVPRATWKGGELTVYHHLYAVYITVSNRLRSYIPER